MKETWYFSFGVGHPLGRKMQPISGTYDHARDKMFEAYGTKWCGQYNAAAAMEMADRHGYTMLPLIDADV